jgi:hypothetical protein
MQTTIVLKGARKALAAPVSVTDLPAHSLLNLNPYLTVSLCNACSVPAFDAPSCLTEQLSLKKGDQS